jgi:hypothetical protein
LIQVAWDSEWLFEVRAYRNFGHRSLITITGVIPKDGRPPLIALPKAREGQQYVPTVPEALRVYARELRSLGASVFGASGTAGSAAGAT